ncbi:hypothetical protein [Bdellovibrio svalbardensis]|uniref:NTF2 fold immunity protein domain-containing protein n=1 Tax=Bdellovibrio svalbardensis TaxID=2972972 RepID=A0ABT6DF25_9BACT|nr:hypothetical protein [Bdellovibrio svalbardensis]MDG0815440.1 hypothetical protein [Bdellovibrio svalbardensis]
MDPWSIQQAQKSLEQLEQCQGLRCVYDFFAKDLSKNSREEIYIFIKDNGPAKVSKACEAKEKPRRMTANEICFSVTLKKLGDVQILWRNEEGQWKLSNASKRKASD